MSIVKIGFALCGSFCTFSRVLPQIKKLVEIGADVYPIMSNTSYSTDTRFGECKDFIAEIEEITQKKIIHTIKQAEPIGPKKLIDILVIEPCTGNTLAKLANSITDTPVTMAAKAHLRNNRPVLVAISTNDGLSGSAKNIGILQNTKNYYFVPYSQDDPIKKPTSLVADFDLTELAIHNALENRQLQPVIK